MAPKQAYTTLAFTLLAASLTLPCVTRAATQAERDMYNAPPEAVREWQAKRFGLFIHWNPSSVLGLNISWDRGGERRDITKQPRPDALPAAEYDNLYKRFNPTNYNPEAWVQIAKDAGMKYLVFTTRHHDGFTMYDSQYTDYKITAPESPYGKDVLAPLVKACREGGLMVGLYYSQPDWHHPDYMTERHEKYIQYVHGQVRELCTNYGDIDIFWFDNINQTNFRPKEMFAIIRKHQPDAVINDRGGWYGDFHTTERKLRSILRKHAWEGCDTVCHQWSWKPNDKMKSLESLLTTLVQAAGRDGNYLLNVGPTPDGRIEARQAKRLREIGAWLETYGDSIYGTRGGPFRPFYWGVSTCKDNRIFVHILDWREPIVKLPATGLKLTGSRLLNGGRVTVAETEHGYDISVPEADRDDFDTIVELSFDGNTEELPLMAAINAPEAVSTGAKAAASSVRDDRHYSQPDKAVNGEELDSWEPEPGEESPWLELDLGRPQRVGKARLVQRHKRIGEIELQFKQDGNWKTFHTADVDHAYCWSDTFKPIQAQHFRVIFTEYKPSYLRVNEFQLFKP